MNKKGFTLMELLSVTIVIAIISTIAFLVVTKFINEAKKDSAIISLKGYVKSVNNYLASCSDGEVDCVIKNDYRYFVEINSDYKAYEITKLTMMDFFVDKVHAASEILDLDESVYLNDVVDAKGILPNDGFFDIIDGEVKQAVAVFNKYRVIYSEDKYYIDGPVVPIPITDFKTSKSSYTLVTGDQVNIAPTPEPINTTDKRIEYTSSDESIATIDKKGILTAHKVGNVTVKIKIANIEKEITIKIKNIYVSGDTVYENTLYDFVQSIWLKNSGTYTINLINNEIINAEVYILDDDTTYDVTPTLCDNVADTKMCIYKYKKNLTISSGVVMTPQVRKKGFLISVGGKITNNGEISMTARGASATGQDVLLFENSDSTFEYVPALGGTGGAAVSIVNSDPGASLGGRNGKYGSKRSTGGGGSGGVFNNISGSATSGAGGRGTSYSGGSGGGSTTVRGTTYVGNSGSSTGGSGGAARSNTYSNSSGYAAGGGAGNPGGAGAGASCCTRNAGSSGTGGLLIIYSGDLENNGTINSKGSMGGYGTGASGGSSGGGSINIFSESFSKYGIINANGGDGQVYGSAGGQGTINVGKIYNGKYYPHIFGFTNDYQVFTATLAGNYKIDLWGAVGGATRYGGGGGGSLVAGGKGAYTSGNIYLNENEQLYVYVGENGIDGMVNRNLSAFNGGSSGSSGYQGGSSGGGSTDIRLVKENKKYRYVRDYIGGNSVNTGNHWVEVEVYDIDGNLISSGKPVSSNCTSLPTLEKVVDGDKATANYIQSASCVGGSYYVEIDLGREFEIGEVKAWHYYGDTRSYNNNIVELFNNDKSSSIQLYNSSVDGRFLELSTGRSYIFNGTVQFESLKSRIMVAGGGGGSSNWSNSAAGGFAGGLTGANGLLNPGGAAHTLATGGTQIAGGNPGGSSASTIGIKGIFGKGGPSQIGHGGGGGGGYYGGGGGGYIGGGVSSGAGGSSYISGYDGCIAIDETSTSSNIIRLANSTHYSNKIFSNPVLIAGNLEMPALGLATQTGNSGNGVAIFTYIGN